MGHARGVLTASIWLPWTARGWFYFTACPDATVCSVPMFDMVVRGSRRRFGLLEVYI